MTDLFPNTQAFSLFFFYFLIAFYLQRYQNIRNKLTNSTILLKKIFVGFILTRIFLKLFMGSFELFEGQMLLQKSCFVDFYRKLCVLKCDDEWNNTGVAWIINLSTQEISRSTKILSKLKSSLLQFRFLLTVQRPI